MKTLYNVNVKFDSPYNSHTLIRSLLRIWSLSITKLFFIFNTKMYVYVFVMLGMNAEISQND